MRKINGLEIAERDEVGEGLRMGRGSRAIAGGTVPLINAACNAFFLRTGMPKSEYGGFRGINKSCAAAGKAAKGRRKRIDHEHDHEHEQEESA